MNRLDLFFRLLNFGIFIALVAYYVKKSLLPTVKAKMAQKKELLTDLDEQELAADARQAKLKQQLEQQDVLYEQLRDKVKRWNDAVEVDQAAKKILLQAELAKALLQLEKQRIAYERTVVARLLPEAYDASLRELQELFNDPKQARAYNEKAVSFLARQVPHGT